MDTYPFDFWGHNFGFWGFIVAIILIGSIFNYLAARSRNEVVREAIRSGQEIDPSVLKSLESNGGRGGLLVGGLVTLAAALGIVVLGYQIGQANGDTEAFEVLKGVAAIPGFVGIALIIAGALQLLFSRKN